MELPGGIKLLLIAGSIFAFTAVIIGCTFMRRSPPQEAFGVIRSKTGYGGGTHLQQQVGTQRGFRTASSIAIAPSYAFEIDIEGLPKPGVCSMAPAAAEKFEVGQRVRVEYVVRGTKTIWSRVFVTNIEAVP